MTRPISAADALRKAVDAQRVQREAIQEVSKEIQAEREKREAESPQPESD